MIKCSVYTPGGDIFIYTNIPQVKSSVCVVLALRLVGMLEQQLVNPLYLFVNI